MNEEEIEEPYARIEPLEIEIRDYMEDVEFVVSSPESCETIGVPASSNVTYQRVYVSIR